LLNFHLIFSQFLPLLLFVTRPLTLSLFVLRF
jgi:hypothetical protein